MNSLKHLKEIALKAIIQKSPELPYPHSFVHNYTDKTEGGFIRCIRDYMKFVCPDARVDRIGNKGVFIKQIDITKNVMGHQKVFDNSKYVPGTGTKGIADMSLMWTNANGMLIVWSCELKTGKDRQRPDQKEYELKTKKAGGHYSIVHNMEEFINQFQELNNKIPNQTKLF